MKNYKPNFNDPRVIERINHAYGFTKAVMSADSPTSWSSRVIDKYFGRSNNKLGRYLRNTLLICTCHHYDMTKKKCKQYITNVRGLSYIKQILMKNVDIAQLGSSMVQDNSSISYTPSVQHLFDKHLINNFCMKEYGNQLSSLDFIYKDKAHRLWNPIQNLKKEVKKSLLSQNGLSYNYDIECSAPTLILQHSRQLGNDLWLPALDEYLNDKQTIRTRISNEIDIPIKQVKVLINSLFCGARIGNSNEFATYYLLDQDPAKIEWFKQDQYLIQLRQDIKTCWDYIEPNYLMRYIITKNLTKRKLPMSSKLKWNIYFQLERQVLNHIKEYLSNTNNKCFLEHDGFTTQNPINETELMNYIKEQTNYSVNFQLEVQQDYGILQDNSSISYTPSVQQVGET